MTQVAEAKRVIICGAGKTAVAIAEWIRQEVKAYAVAGFVDDKKREHDYPHARILGGFDDLPRIRDERGVENIVLGFPFPTRVKIGKARELRDMGFNFPSVYPHGLDEKWGVDIGEGVLIYHAEVNSGAKIGDFVGINHCATIEACEIGEGAVITPGVFIGEGCYIGEGSVVLPNSVIPPRRRIGEFCLISAGEQVLKDMGDNKMYSRGRVSEVPHSLVDKYLGRS